MRKSFLVGPLLLLTAIGCARLAIEGGEKPIHIVMDVNMRIAREVDEFFAFEDKHPATTQTTQSVLAAPGATQK